MEKKITVRFAPSPTGPLHIGGIRTLLYNYLWAKKHKGQFILRIEDTDQKRSIKEAEKYIQATLNWLGIIPDQDPDIGGPFAPYRQSERLLIYQSYIQRLIDQGNAYYAFDTETDLESMRCRLTAAKVVHPHYNGMSRLYMQNSLTLPQSQVQEWIDGGKPYVIRLKVAEKQTIRFYDMVRGWVKVDSGTLEDKVLVKSNGIPTYHFANVIDDYLMQITHVIRGEEWLPSMPIHFLLYHYLGWQTDMPQFVHLPLLLAPDGKGKLSKRHAEQYGFPVFPITWADSDLTVQKSFREQGYLPGALINFLALLGWNPKTGQELFTLQELIETFSLDHIGKSAAKFNIKKMDWLNQQHIKRQGTNQWANYMITEARKSGYVCEKDEVIPLCEFVQDRVVFPADFWTEAQFFYIEPMHYDTNLLKKQSNWKSQKAMQTLSESLIDQFPTTEASLKEMMSSILKKYDLLLGEFMPLLRMALTGAKSGGNLVPIILILGQEKTNKRLARFIQKNNEYLERITVQALSVE